MMRRAVAAVGVLLILCGVGVSQTAPKQSKDEAAVRAVIANLAAAWNKADAKLWGDQFTEDADFTAWTGGYVKGREAIARGHVEVFNVFYPGTKQRYNVLGVRFLRKDVAAARVEGSVVKREEEFPAAPQVVFVAVLTKENGQWKIAVFQNTRIQSRQNSKQ